MTRLAWESEKAGEETRTLDIQLGNSGAIPSSLTTHLYSGEQTDAATGLQYLRARYYDPSSGRFNRLDPFVGNQSDPLSLHKYLYTHGNPVNGIDQSGLFTLGELLKVAAIGAIIATAGLVTYNEIGKTNYNVSPNPPAQKSVGIDVALGGKESFSHWLEGVNMDDLARQLQAAGHKVTLVRDPDENQFIGLLNNNDIVFTFSHGSNPNVLDKNNQPLMGLGHAGTSQHPDDSVLGLSGVSAGSAWITANEVDGNVANMNIEMVVAGCQVEHNDRWFRALPRGSVVTAPSVSINAAGTQTMIRYLVDRANGATARAAFQSVNAQNPGQYRQYP